MSDNFAAVGLLLAFAIGLPIVVMAVVHLLAPHKPHREKLTTYECGNEPIGRAWIGFKSNYFLYAIVFTAFDIETVFLYPWALTFRKLGTFAFAEMFIFLIILIVGFWYAWKEGALEWM
ncbi:NADH-quinone oxidoreductase subunit A [Desulfosporosinus sp. PR]|uniref:NADH-quinone oxidoreductase subunit A n=1 Tax=Candidatus Desulfosporosinus nitrosoreducens TaxID=3401928 RepID=UPI0027F2682E|nr:NADH-quinone oxidoreductase subunit A [Desulfosporosinus sp. PR]MDQ7093280.1 NADH-quinone oxidoreductase subunit A [Desulfosporosinus sp. PR]